MAKFIKYTQVGVSQPLEPGFTLVDEVIIRADKIVALCKNSKGYYVRTELVDKVVDYKRAQVLIEEGTILCVSKSQYEMTQRVISGDDGQDRGFHFPFPEDVFQDANDEEKERERIKKALDEHNGCIPCTAKALGMTERTLVRKKKDYGL